MKTCSRTTAADSGPWLIRLSVLGLGLLMCSEGLAQDNREQVYGAATVAASRKAPVVDGKIEPGEWDGTRRDKDYVFDESLEICLDPNRDRRAAQWQKAPEKKWLYRLGADPEASVRFAYYPSFRFVRVFVDPRELSKELGEKAKSARVTPPQTIHRGKD